MKKTGMMLTGLLTMLMITGTLFAQASQDRMHPRERLRNALQIRQEMREMERKVIDNDAELQAVMESIKKLHQQMREKLDAKLGNNAEYQELKKQLEEMRAEWQKTGPRLGPEERPLEKKKQQSK